MAGLPTYLRMCMRANLTYVPRVPMLSGRVDRVQYPIVVIYTIYVL